MKWWCLHAAALLAACAQGRPEGDAIVVAIANSPANLDPGVGAAEASQKAHQRLYNPLVWIGPDLRIVPEFAESLEQPDPLTCVRPSPIADFTFLKDVFRNDTAAAP